jgi:hypothetical protein
MTQVSRRMKLLVRAGMAVVLVAAGIGATASASSAATPVCRQGYGNWITQPYTWGAFTGPAGTVVTTPSANGSIGCYIPIGYNQYSDWTNNIYTTSPVETGVGLLQKTLNLCYGFNLVVDGIYGSATTAAVKHVQAQYRIPGGADGIYGMNTAIGMFHPTVTASHQLVTPCRQLA